MLFTAKYEVSNYYPIRGFIPSSKKEYDKYLICWKSKKLFWNYYKDSYDILDLISNYLSIYNTKNIYTSNAIANGDIIIGRRKMGIIMNM